MTDTPETPGQEPDTDLTEPAERPRATLPEHHPADVIEVVSEPDPAADDAEPAEPAADPPKRGKGK